jgi:hypothetical protein
MGALALRMESDTAYIGTWGGWFSNTTKNHHELSQVFAKREDILSDCINLTRQIYFCSHCRKPRPTEDIAIS